VGITLTLPRVLLRQPSGCFLVMLFAQNTLSVQCKQAWVTKTILLDRLYSKHYRWQKSKCIHPERVFRFSNLNSMSCALSAQGSIFCWLSSCKSPPFIYGTTSNHLKAVKNFITCMLVCHARNHLQFGLWTSDFPYYLLLSFSGNLENNWGIFENSADFVSLKVVVPFHRFPFWLIISIWNGDFRHGCGMVSSALLSSI